jgi:predicted anti-sigma-YlaC factor YlaD
MNRVNCESIRLAAMAVADGENPLIPAPDIELHLSTCDHCRSDVAQLQSLLKLLDGQHRRERTEILWDGIAEDLRPKTALPTTADHWPWFMLLGLLVAVYRIAVSTSDWEPGWWLKLAPVLLVIAVFGLLRENPFKVNTELKITTSAPDFNAR